MFTEAMLIVISSDSFLSNETQKIVSLFEAGLETFHLRKTRATALEYRKILEEIPEKFHRRIVLHDFHNLVENMEVKGVHLKERKRCELEEKKSLVAQCLVWQNKGLSVSTSYHNTEVLEQEQAPFDYAFLSPVFDSISKKEYKQKKFQLPSISFPIVALGGLAISNIPTAFAWGYNGVALLGIVWNAENCAEAFARIKQVYEKNFKYK